MISSDDMWVIYNNHKRKYHCKLSWKFSHNSHDQLCVVWSLSYTKLSLAQARLHVFGLHLWCNRPGQLRGDRAIGFHVTDQSSLGWAGLLVACNWPEQLKGERDIGLHVLTWAAQGWACPWVACTDLSSSRVSVPLGWISTLLPQNRRRGWMEPWKNHCSASAWNAETGGWWDTCSKTILGTYTSIGNVVSKYNHSLEMENIRMHSLERENTRTRSRGKETLTEGEKHTKSLEMESTRTRWRGNKHAFTGEGMNTHSLEREWTRIHWRGN